MSFRMRNTTTEVEKEKEKQKKIKDSSKISTEEYQEKLKPLEIAVEEVFVFDSTTKKWAIRKK